jgi:hypothetical protein
VRGRLCGPAWIWIAALCMTTACIYAGTAFFQVSLQRYADPLAPLLFAASATAVASACAWLARRLPTAPAAAHRAGGA